MEALIVADDLSGAADCAAASGTDAVVMLSLSSATGARVVALDLDSRELAPEAAAARANAAIEAVPPGNALVYQKLDSTLRGNWAWELDALASGLAERRSTPLLTVLCPAFPERGRTVVDGTACVEGRPLPEGHIGQRLAEAGRWGNVIPGGLGPAELRHALEATAAQGGVAICDASSRGHLNMLAAASLSYGNAFWAGSAGMIGSLAPLMDWPGSAAGPTAGPGCVLVVVGSASPVSRGQTERLAEQPDVESIVCPPDLLVSADNGALEQLTMNIEAAAQRASCVVISVDASVAPIAGARLVAGLARLVVPLLPLFGGLVLTGGETARAALSNAGVTALDILGECEPGVPFGRTIGALVRPVITKAGGFGTPDTLIHAVGVLTGTTPHQERVFS